MTKNHRKARWPAAQAVAIEQQVQALAGDRSGDWQARRRRAVAAAALRREADRFRAMARRWAPPDAA